MSDAVVKVRGVGKKYLINQRRYLTKELVKSMLLRRPQHVDFWALQDINCDVYPGESVGIIGENGSGKSTLLKILANVTEPTTGKIEVQGRISALLELGAGFHLDLTGRENIYLNGVIMGLRKRYIDEKLDAIIELSGISKFIDTPVRFYSSGMYVRLGFAIAVHIDPDVLVIDEVLAVGDEEFQRKCKAAIQDYRTRGKSLVVVSHDLSIIRDVCDRVLWLKEGRIYQQGPVARVTSDYLLYVSARFGFVTLSDGPVTVIFERGKLIIFWKGIEVTKNTCGFTYLVASGTNQSSDQNSWEIITRTETALKATTRWRLMPLEQTWEIELLNQNSFRWRITMKVLESIGIQNDTVNILLTDCYREWAAGEQEGEFPPEFFESFGQRLIGVDAGSGAIGAKAVDLGKARLPAIKFALTDLSRDFLAQVTNTDRHQRARCLQFSRIRDNSLYSAGETLEFEGIVTMSEGAP